MKHALPALSISLLMTLVAAQTTRPPNFLLVNTDDQPAWWVGASDLLIPDGEPSNSVELS